MRAGLIAGSVLIHAAVLLPIALSTPRAPPAPDLDLFVLPLDLTPGPSKRRLRQGASPAEKKDDPQTASPARASGEARSVPTPPAPRLPSEVAAEGPAIEDSWRVRAGLRPPARLPCPPAPGDRLGQRLCLVGPAPDRDPEPETYAEIAPSRRDPSDREDGFARQAQANEAWRDYTRGEGAYPGLRSLFRER